MPAHSHAVQWNGDRVFVTTAFGCPARCLFCYLRSVGLDQPRRPDFAPDLLRERMVSDARFRQGARGSLISIGCLGEPLAPHATEATMSFLESLIGLHNPIQIATRWVLSGDQFHRFLSVAASLSISIFHSFSSMPHARGIEVGTPALELRQAFMARCSSEGIKSVLYIKPFLPGITSQGVHDFLRFMEATGIRHAVVGPMYTDKSIMEHLTRILPSGWRDSLYGITSLPFAPGQGDFGSESPELTDFVSVLESADITVTRHGWEMARFQT